MTLSVNLLRNLVIEMSLAELGQELSEYLKSAQHDSSSDSDSSLDSDISDSIEEDEKAFLTRILEVFRNLDQFPDEIARPYRQPGATREHVNVVTVHNFSSKFPPGRDRDILRFEKRHIIELIDVLRLPTFVQCVDQQIPAFEALVVFLRRLAYPGRYIDIMTELDRDLPTLSMIFNSVAVQIFEKWGDTVRSLEHGLFLDRDRQEEYARAIFAKGCPFDNVTHFGDGTCIRICRPSVFQERFYCGHHGHHCFKVLLIELPNGICFAFGPFSGASHDSSAAQELELDTYLRSRLTYPDTEFMGMYDAGYAASDVMLTPGRRSRARTDPLLAAFNLDFSRTRITNEQGIGKVKTLFAFLSYHKNLKVLLSPVGVYFFDAVLLTNLHTIYYGSQVASYFDLPVPTVQDYLGE